MAKFEIEFFNETTRNTLLKTRIDRVILRYTIADRNTGTDQIVLEFGAAEKICIYCKMINTNCDLPNEIGSLRIDNCSSPDPEYLSEEIHNGPFWFNGIIIAENLEDKIRVQAGVEFARGDGVIFRALPGISVFKLVWVNCKEPNAYEMCEFSEKEYLLVPKGGIL